MDDLPRSSAYWAEVLYYRLTGQLARIESGPKTVVSEDVLGFSRSVYFYVGKCFPDFGDLLIAHTGRVRRADVLPKVTPFDTGGLVHGHIPTKHELTDEEKKDLVATHTFVGNRYWKPFRRWISAAFRSASDYVRGERPALGGAAVIDLNGPIVDARAWAWEGRLDAKNYSKHPVRPVRVIASPLKRRQYIDWVRQHGMLGRIDAARHVDQVFRMFQEAEEPVSTMESFIMKGRSLGTR